MDTVLEEKKSPQFDPDSLAIITEAGNIVKVTSLTHYNLEQTIQLLEGGDEYVVLSTGEVKEVQHTENRAENTDSIKKTFQRLAMLINANTTNPTHCRFITLTYEENMKNTKILYHDFALFFKRFRYFCKKENFGKPEYIAVAEPQARGAWHLHVILIFPKRAPFIPNDTLADLWGHGFVHVRSIDNVDNVGAYLCTYLTDLELPKGDSEFEALATQAFKFTEHKVNGKAKRFIKGGRLHLYPTGMRIYRCSKGVKRPVTWKTTMAEAYNYTGDMVQTYSRLSSYTSDDSSFETSIYTAFYNRAREGKTANGYYSKLWGPMHDMVIKKRETPAEPYTTPPEPTAEDYRKEKYETISDENFRAIMHWWNPEPAEPPEWAQDEDEDTSGQDMPF